jgi:hypothetical protein
MVEQLLLALLGTELIELSVAWLLGVRQKRDLMNLGLINIITNLPFNFLLFLIVTLVNVSIFQYWLIVLFFEVIVAIIEAGLFKQFILFNKIKPLRLAIILNATSFMVGVIIERIL